MAHNHTGHGGHLMHLDHLNHMTESTVSNLVPFSSLIMTVSLACIFLVRYYVFEGYLAKIYGDIYYRLDDRRRRGFVNHHVAGSIKILLIIAAAYPVIAVITKKSLHSPYAGSHVATLGDVLLVCSNIFTCMYVFELFYRTDISPISIVHHIGAILIAQTGIVLSETRNHRSDGALEFIMCLLWGFFDILAELWPHIAIILKRVYKDNHKFLRNVFMVACCTEAFGTVIETIVVMTIFGSLWSHWTIELKIVTPILHVMFSAAQLWGAKNFWEMYNEEVAILAEEDRVRKSEESVSVDGDSGVWEQVVVVVGGSEGAEKAK